VSYSTSLREHMLVWIKHIGTADILVGIPCFNNQETIAHVIERVSEGLAVHFGQMRAVLIISDGGSTDDTREVARRAKVRPGQEKLVTIYRGIAGKGTALRAIFEAAERLSVRGVMVVDSDLRSITGDWVRNLLEPVFEHDQDFVAPIYTRFKYDGTITNNIAYNLTRALYGRRIRQPIGGDFAFSLNCVRSYLSQNVWETDIARFGIDIWLTTTAIVEGFHVCQSRLGVKVHDAKDPAAHLAPMFRQVLFTLFSLMEDHEMYWKLVSGSEPTPVYGEDDGRTPEPVAVNHRALCQTFRGGYQQFGVLWERVFSPGVYQAIRQAAAAPDDRLDFEIDVWVKLLYELAATFHRWKSHRYKLLELATPLYHARVASFINRTRDLDSTQAEQVVEEQAVAFEQSKALLLRYWELSAMTEDALGGLMDASQTNAVA